MRSSGKTFAAFVVSIAFAIICRAKLLAHDPAPLAATPANSSDAQILVLEDGGVLEGDVTRAADWFFVSRGNSQIQISAKRVMIACHSIEEAYEFRRRRITDSKAEPHLSLADWCMRNNLFREAEQELTDARRLDPDHPRIALLTRQLDVLRTHSSTKPNHEPTTPARTPVENVPPKSIATLDDLPNGVVDRFTRKVQPVLVNNCTTSGCHRPGGPQSFQLDRAILRGESNRRTTMQNLEATLALIDREHPDQSPLLLIPRKSHAGMPNPILGQRQDAPYHHLVDWVALVVPPPPPPPPAADPPAAKDETSPGTPTNTPPMKISTLPAREPLHSEVVPLTAEKSNKTDARAASANFADSPAHPTLRPPHQLKVGATLKSWQPRDAFDPEIFNRAQRTGASPPPEITSAHSAQLPTAASAADTGKN